MFKCFFINLLYLKIDIIYFYNIQMNKKILHLNFSDDGGAAIAVLRIHNVLKKNNYNSKILVAEKINNS